MAVVIEIFLICDGGCGDNFGVDNRNATIGQQRKGAKENGWKYSKGKDFCPNCQTKRKHKKP